MEADAYAEATQLEHAEALFPYDEEVDSRFGLRARSLYIPTPAIDVKPDLHARL